MRKIRVDVLAVLMLGAALVSDSAIVLLVYLAAAFLHEMGHILAARVLKIRIDEIRLGFSGARIVTTGLMTYTEEILLAAAGPLVNFAVFFSILTAFLMSDNCFDGLILSADSFIYGKNVNWQGVVAFFALSSLVQGIMNLLPVKTFDGGRIFFCAVAQTISERAADKAIELTTLAACLVLWAGALYLMIRIGGGLGIYVFAVCIFLGGLGSKSEKSK